MANRRLPKPDIEGDWHAGQVPGARMPRDGYSTDRPDSQPLASGQPGGKRQAGIPSADAQSLVLGSPWRKALTDDQLQRVLADLTVREISAGNYVWRVGHPVDHWAGVISGLIKLSVVSAKGKETTFLGVGSGGWIGESTFLRAGHRQYDAIALQASAIACIPRSTFYWLIENSLPFNHAMLRQVGDRLAQVVETLISGRVLPSEAHVAYCLASLCHPRLGQKGGAPFNINISQEELGNLAGLSRQRANHALQALLARGLLSVRPGGVTIPDPEALRAFAQ